MTGVYQMRSHQRDKRHGVPIPVLPDDTVILPGVYCPECQAKWHFLAEADGMFVSDQVFEELQFLVGQFTALASTHGVNGGDGRPSILPEEWRQLTSELSRLLGLPEHRFHERQNINHRLVGYRLTKLPPSWDVWGGAPYSKFLLTKEAAEALNASGLTGFQLHPIEVYNRHYALCEDTVFYTLEVYGRGGVPITEPSGFWQRCRRCKQWQLTSYREYHFAVDESQWDGSDFFRFVDYGPVIITERARKWLEQSGLRLWIEFVDIDWRWYLDAASREIARAERRRKWGEPFGISQED